MPLPKIDLPIFTITLPLSKKKLTLKPFVTREEKILYQALESGDEGAMVTAIKQLVTNCAITEIDVDKLPILDLEYIFIQLRARSVGEVVNARYTCQHETDGKVCNNLVTIPINIQTLEPTMPKEDFSVVQVTEDTVMKLKYPTFEIVNELAHTQESDDDVSYKILAKCIESVCKGDEVFDKFTLEEAVDFLLSLKRDVFEKVEKFLNNQPEIKVVLDFNCLKCGYKDTIEINGLDDLSDFFD